MYDWRSRTYHGGVQGADCVRGGKVGPYRGDSRGSVVDALSMARKHRIFAY